MVYLVFREGTDEQIAELHVDWPLIQKGEIIPILVQAKESLYTVTKVGQPQIAIDRLVVEVWVKDYFESR